MSKRSRGPNFTPHEKEILIHLINKYKDIVENKKTDAVTTAAKNDGWMQLKDEFNSLSSFYVRNTEQLKTLWDNIKRTTKKDKAQTKKETFLSGGGRPNQPPTQGSLQRQVEAILGPSLDGFHSPFDTDARFKETETPIVSLNCASVSSKGALPDRTGWSPTILKTKMNTRLQATTPSTPIMSRMQRRRPKTSLQDIVLESKLELVEMTKKNLEKESQIKLNILEMQQQQEEIKLEMLRLQLDALKNKQ